MRQMEPSRIETEIKLRFESHEQAVERLDEAASPHR